MTFGKKGEKKIDCFVDKSNDGALKFLKPLSGGKWARKFLVLDLESSLFCHKMGPQSSSQTDIAIRVANKIMTF